MRRFGDILRVELAKKNMTQTELAEKIGVKQSHISMIISGKTNPSYTTISKIKSVLDIDFFDSNQVSEPESEYSSMTVDYRFRVIESRLARLEKYIFELKMKNNEVQSDPL